MDWAAKMGDRLLQNLQSIQQQTRCIGNVRGRGLMIGVEVVNSDGQMCGEKYPVYPAMAQRIQAECLRRGLILELGGRFGSVVRFLPPLIVTTEQIDSISEIFAAAVQAAESQVLAEVGEC